MGRCVAIRCQEVGIHKFPRDFQLRRMWEEAVNYKSSDFSRLCRKHFKKTDYETTNKTTGFPHIRNFLKKSAVPSLLCYTESQTSTIAQTEQLQQTNSKANNALPDNTTLHTERIGRGGMKKNILMHPFIESEDDLSTEKKVNIFCPKCKSEVEHTAKGIQQDQIKSIILKVYHYFEQEYKELKKAFKALDLTPLSRFRERVALATGVSETTVLEILKEEEERNVYRNKQPQKRRRVPKKPTTPESLPEEDSSDASDDDDEHREQHEHTGKVDEERAVPAVFPVEVKIETRDDDVAHPHAQFSTYVETLTVKIEPPDVDYDKPQTEITIDPLTVKVEPRDDEENKQLRQAGSSTAEYTSNVSANEEFDNTSNIKRKKTASERAKEYRERQKLLKASTSSADHQRGATKQAKLSAKQYRERQQLLKTSESSAGKQQSTSNTKQKKTAAERAKEYRERQKLLKASTSSADHQQRQHTQGESSTSEYTRNVAGNEGFDESYVIKKITEIKMEIQEEGFS